MMGAPETCWKPYFAKAERLADRDARSTAERGLGTGSLCDRCSYSHAVRRRGASEAVLFCRLLLPPVSYPAPSPFGGYFFEEHAARIPTDIDECSRYTPMNRDTTMTLSEMEERALTVDPREEPRGYM
jgi:hypothetical protein